MNEASDEDNESEEDDEQESTYTREWMANNLEQWNAQNRVEAILREQLDESYIANRSPFRPLSYQHRDAADDSRAHLLSVH